LISGSQRASSETFPMPVLLLASPTQSLISIIIGRTRGWS